MICSKGEEYRHLEFSSKAIMSMAKNYTLSEKQLLILGRNEVFCGEYPVTMKPELPIISCVLLEPSSHKVGWA